MPPPAPPATPTATEPGETEAIDHAAVAQWLVGFPTATPFASRGSDDEPAPVAPPPPASDGPHPQMGETERIDPADIQAAFAGRFPLPAASIDRLPLPLEQYGALVARSEAVSGASELSALYAEYGVQDAAHRRRIDEEYGAVFEHHPELRSTFDDVVAQWRTYLRRG